MAEINETPSGLRTHIAFFGKVNAGKSSLINALCGQEVSIVSPEQGTTTDPVYKPIEIQPIGPCLLIDTAGLVDETSIGEKRLEKTREVMKKTDIAVMVFDGKSDGNDHAEKTETSEQTKENNKEKNIEISAERLIISEENNEERIEVSEEDIKIIRKLNSNNIPVICVLNHDDNNIINENNLNRIKQKIQVSISNGDRFHSESNSSGESANTESKTTDQEIVVIPVNALTGEGIDALRSAIIRAANASNERTIIGNLVNEGDSVLLVMPQDKQAPKGRLILPQVTTIRELLDKHCIVTSVSTGQIDAVLLNMKNPPKLIITDSQVFDTVYEKKPPQSMLTSFSVLYAGLKGDIKTYIDGARSIEKLKDGARILIAESCSHAPMEEDIGRVKIPTLIRKYISTHSGYSVNNEMIKTEDQSDSNFADQRDADYIVQSNGKSADQSDGNYVTQPILHVDICAGADFPADLSEYDLVIQCGGCMSNRRAIMSRIEQAREQGVPITNYGICIAWLKGIMDKIVIPGS